MSTSEDTLNLFKSWCYALKTRQILNTSDKRLDGAIMCPSCGKIHGRCFEAMYPFLLMDTLEENSGWSERAECLFDWGNNTLTLPDGSFLNDIDSEWCGTTVFNLIAMLDSLRYHSNRMSDEFKSKVIARSRVAADYLVNSDSLMRNNINYPVTNSYAMYLAYTVLGDEKYKEASEKFATCIDEVFTENNIIFGEGIPRENVTPRGCKSVDIGYNLEETLPSIASLATITGNKALKHKAVEGFRAHLVFLLENGFLDNSFGTRNFKWTSWGSRTSDGMLYGLLLLADKDPRFIDSALANLDIIRKCTVNGLLSGGVDYLSTGNEPCVHHTFEHAKVIAACINENLLSKLDSGVAVSPFRGKIYGFKHYKEIDSYIYGNDSWSATISSYDWDYIPGGHPSGGSVTMLYHKKAGIVLSSSMHDYFLKEKNNMQVPNPFNIHRPLSQRIENGKYSNIFDNSCTVTTCGDLLCSEGYFADIDHNRCERPFRMEYSFGRCFECKAEFEDGVFILPLISKSDEEVSLSDDSITIKRHDSLITLKIEKGTFDLPYKERRIFHLTPGLEALEVDIRPIDGEVKYSIFIK